MTNMSLPARERELKHYITCVMSRIHTSLPARERELKLVALALSQPQVWGRSPRGSVS